MGYTAGTRRTLVLGIVLALLLSPLALAQEKPQLPESPEPHTHKVFWLGEGALAAAKSADSLSTAGLQSRGGWENNPILGKHPSNGKLAGYMAASFAVDTTAFYFTEHNRRAWVRWAGLAYIAFVIEEHTRLAGCNASLDTRSATAHNCRSFLPF